MSDAGFIKLQRTQETYDLMRDRNAFHLLSIIAIRARFSAQPSHDGVTFGQAFLGDVKAYGMSEKEYRCAKARLEKWGFASFKGSAKGTVATLSDSRVFSIRDERNMAKKGGPTRSAS